MLTLTDRIFYKKNIVNLLNFIEKETNGPITGRIIRNKLLVYILGNTRLSLVSILSLSRENISLDGNNLTISYKQVVYRFSIDQVFYKQLELYFSKCQTSVLPVDFSQNQKVLTASAAWAVLKKILTDFKADFKDYSQDPGLLESGNLESISAVWGYKIKESIDKARRVYDKLHLRR